jgi:hypothetical protein
VIRLLLSAGLFAAALGGFLWFVHYERGIGEAKERAVWVEVQQEQTRLLMAEQRRQAESQAVITTNLQTKVNDAKAAATSASAAADSLRERYTSLIAAACAPAASAPVGETAGSTARVLTELLDRITTLARRYAQIADDRGNAGKAAEELYDSVTR